MRRGSDISPLSVLLNQVDAVADGAPARGTVPTGFPSIDRLLGGGFRRGDLIVLGGDVGSGKSSLALAIALRTAESKRGVAFLSGEMSRERVMERALAVEGRARVDDLRTGALDDATRAAVGAAVVRLRDVMPNIEHIPHAGAKAIEELIDDKWNVELLVVDSLQSLSPGVMPRDEELAAATQALKHLAVALDVAVLVTSHLPLLAARQDRRPQLDDFGALGAVKQHADVVLGLFREEMYEPSRGNEGATELAVLKNRNGGTGYVDLYFYAKWMRFEDMLDPDR
jgi:replicative DNA helicase